MTNRGFRMHHRRWLSATLAALLVGGVLLVGGGQAGSQNGEQCVGKIFGDTVPSGTFSLDGGSITFDGNNNPLGFTASGVLITSITVFGAGETVTRTFPGGTTSGTVFGPAKTVGDEEGFHDVSHVTEVCFIAQQETTTTTSTTTTTTGPPTTTTTGFAAAEETTTTTAAEVAGVVETTTTTTTTQPPAQVAGAVEERERQQPQPAPAGPAAAVEAEPRFTG